MDEWVGCEVRVGDGRIVVSYQDDAGEVLYTGTEPAPGHFLLSDPNRKGKASLHGLPNARILVGYWIEDGYEGFWRIHLK